MIDLRRLEQFFVLVKIGNFTRASQELNISQSALTRSVQALELQLGARLLERERGRSGLTVTLAGAELFERAGKLLTELDEMRSAIGGLPRRPQRRLAFGIGPLMGGMLLPDFLRSRIATDPDLVLTVCTNSSDQMTGSLLDEEIEFYIGLPATKGPSARIRSELFAQFSRSFFVRPGHPLLELSRLAVDDLLHFPRISGTAWDESLAALASERERLLYSAAARVDDNAVLTEVALGSDAVLISSTAQRNGPLVRLPVSIDLAARTQETSVFTLAGARLSATAQEAIEELRELYSAMTPSPEDAPLSRVGELTAAGRENQVR